VLILEGIGMTENSSFTHVNRHDNFRFGTVGVPGPGIEARIAPDGEILVRGPVLMKGYHKDPAATGEAIDAQGWLHTGDVGEIDVDGFLTVTDRKKDLIVTSGGKNIAPQRVEHALIASTYLSQAVVFGDRRKFLVALVALDAEAIRGWAARNGKRDMTGAALAADAEVQALVQAEVEAVNKTLAPYETVKRVRVLPREMSVEGGELTPTLKVRRKVVAQKYQGLIDEMYAE
jgi:long-chain acyl-CoA synthetase